VNLESNRMIVQNSLESIDQSTKLLKEPHTSTREATFQHHHAGSKPFVGLTCVAKRRRLGGLRANRASVSLRDSLNISGYLEFGL